MYVVIFRAEAVAPDDDYAAMAAMLRDMALRDFGCLEFCAVTEARHEIALSYWPDLASIKAWKAQAEHMVAQRLGREHWYSAYRLQIAHIEKDYTFSRNAE
ncbi:MAG: antibiotic biosynthesis monooxygenase family protein [Acidocella sp.]|uniref:antibiotic biosynthesis monooxygenase family protein n=1 Tax=Acidocella sp. TaxID=50710 RepID=UPI003FC54154